MNKKILSIGVIVFVIALAVGLMVYYSRTSVPVVTPDTNDTAITYTNNEYGFTFSLPIDWQGYTIVNNKWSENALTTTVGQSGPKILIRNPKWTEAMPYEDLPLLVFTISQWNSYQAEDFSVSAAPIQATELARNNKYVFALPPRWDFDYSLGYKQAQGIIAGNPLHAFNVGTDVPQGRLNINIVCEQSLTYMTFADAKSAEVFVVDCKKGKYPEVIEKYKIDMNLGDGATI